MVSDVRVQHHADRTIHDPLRYSRSRAGGRADDLVAAEGRRGLHQFRSDDRRRSGATERQHPAGSGFLAPPGALDSLQGPSASTWFDTSNNHSSDLKLPGIQNTLEEVGPLNLAHAGTGNTLAEAVCAGLS